MCSRKISCLILALSIIGGIFSASAETLNLGLDAYETNAEAVTITVSDEVINTVKSGVFGANNGYRAGGYGIYDEEKCVFNENMLHKIIDSGITHIREPGGIEGDYFHWYECVGPQESRVAQVNPFSMAYPSYTEKEGEPYDVVFGPDEWIELCKKTGISLTIQLNNGTGTPQEAVDFIRYSLDSGVEIESIAVGNESCMKEERVEGISVTCSPDEYIAFYNEVIRLIGDDMKMELKQKGIPFGCIGLPGSHVLSIHRKWDNTVLAGVSEPADFIDIHIGYSPFSVNLTGVDAKTIHLGLLASSYYVKNLLQMEVKSIASNSPDTLIKMSEYGPLGNNMCYGTAGALYLASFFQTILNEEKVFSADYLPLCYTYASRNTLIGANTAQDLYWDNVVTYVFRMYTEQTGRKVLSTAMEGGATFKAQPVGLMPRQLNVPVGDAAVYYDDETGVGTLFILNKAYDENTVFNVIMPFESMTVTAVTELWDADYSKANTQAEPEAVVPVSIALAEQQHGSSFTVTAKPVSLIKIDFTTGK